MKKIMVFISILFILAPSVFAQRQTELWRDVTSRDELIGRWEGSVIQDIPRDVDAGIPETSIELIILIEHMQNTDEVSVNLKFDINKFLTDMLELKEIKSLGITKNDLWELFSELFMLLFETEGEIIDTGKYYITLNSSASMDVSDTGKLIWDDNGIIQINESENKIRIMFFNDFSFDLGDSPIKEIILDKI